MKLVFLPSTRADLVWMRTYYEKIFVDGARRAAAQYRKSCDLIQANPSIGHPVEGMERVREFSVPRTPFSFIYRVIGNRIEILRVWDQRGDRSRLG